MFLGFAFFVVVVAVLLTLFLTLSFAASELADWLLGSGRMNSMREIKKVVPAIYGVGCIPFVFLPLQRQAYPLLQAHMCGMGCECEYVSELYVCACEHVKSS